MLTDTKKWYHSKTIISSLVTVFASLLGLAGVVIADDLQPIITNGILAAVTLASSIMAIYGRMKADTKVSK